MWLRIAILVFLCLFASLPARAAEVVKSFDAEIVLKRSGKVRVTETISIVSEGKVFKHGIYRDIPLAVMTKKGMEPVAFEVVKVERDGEPENHMRGLVADGARVYLGKSDVILAPGKHVYRWTYLIDNQIRDAGDNRDMFAWNVTGRWDLPIESAWARISFPDGTHVLETQQHAGTPEMSFDNVIRTVEGGLLVLKSVTLLQPGGSLQFKVLFPKNFFERPL